MLDGLISTPYSSLKYWATLSLFSCNECKREMDDAIMRMLYLPALRDGANREIRGSRRAALASSAASDPSPSLHQSSENKVLNMSF